MVVISKGFSILIGIILFAMLLILMVLVVNSSTESVKPRLTIAGSVLGMISFMNIKSRMKGAMSSTLRLTMVVIIALIVIAIIFGLVSNVEAGIGGTASDFIYGLWPF